MDREIYALGHILATALVLLRTNDWTLQLVEFTHFIIDRREQITPGMLASIRPDDAHTFQNFNTAPCRMINVAFSQTTADFLQHRYGGELGSWFFWS